MSLLLLFCIYARGYGGAALPPLPADLDVVRDDAVGVAEAAADAPAACLSFTPRRGGNAAAAADAVVPLV